MTREEILSDTRVKNRKFSVVPNTSSGEYWMRRVRQLPRAPLENTACSFILLHRFFLEIIMKLERKVKNTRSIGSKDFFLEITMSLGEKDENTRSIRSENINMPKIKKLLFRSDTR